MPQTNSNIETGKEGKGKGILVVGGGISGITTAIEAAETGYWVILVEQLPYLGGRAIEMNRYFPKLCPPYCGMEINFKRIKQNQRISYFTSTRIKAISGTEGDFQVKLETRPQMVNNNCTLCGDCSDVCPVEISDCFNYNMNKTKAIYLPHEMAFPERYTIDSEHCEKSKCGKCVDVCGYNAIDLTKEAESFELEVGSIVFATGWEPYNAEKIEDLKFGIHQDIITNMMMERMLAANGPSQGNIFCPSDGRNPEKIAFVQCAGSRDEKHLPYCSGVCCSASIKQALTIVQQNTEIEVKIYYIDLRLAGRNEDFLRKAEEHPRIELIKGKVALVNIDNNKPGFVAEDIMSGRKITSEVDILVLATGIVPNISYREIIKYNKEGFILDTELEKGIYSAGCAKKPMDISSSVKDATGTALKAIQSVR
ncbi:FAD-dependent oxidoreductase [Bacteroidota bacterium]